MLIVGISASVTIWPGLAELLGKRDNDALHARGCRLEVICLCTTFRQ